MESAVGGRVGVRVGGWNPNPRLTLPLPLPLPLPLHVPLTCMVVCRGDARGAEGVDGVAGGIGWAVPGEGQG